jgi:PAT family beta-lactamase induction signal transducer AmpG
MYIAGYRVAMLVSGAGSLWLAAYMGGESYDIQVWRKVYLIMSTFMAIGILAVIYSNEPKIIKNRDFKINDHWKFLLFILVSILIFGFFYNNLNNPFQKHEIILTLFFSIIRILLCFLIIIALFYLCKSINIIDKKIIKKAYLNPVQNFIKKYGKFAILILLLIAFYRIADVVMGVVANIFYLEKGYTVSEIATYSKFFGLIATILGGLLGGFSAYRIGTMKALFIGALIASSSNVLFAWLATMNTDIKFLISVIIADNVSSGFAGAAFVVYLSNLTSIKFTATQYALFSSIMLFFPKLIAGYSGSWVDFMGYEKFFITTALLGIPVLFLIIYLTIKIPVKD